MSDLLTHLADFYGTDKGNAITNCIGVMPHNFTKIYHQYFAPLRFHVRSLLEIGVHKGASLRMWADYFPNAKIIGIDSDPANIFETDRIKTYKINQTDKTGLEKLCDDQGSAFDIIIDDGSHYIFEQQLTFCYLFKYLLKGGFYIIEDIHTSCATFDYLNYYGLHEDHPHTTLNVLKNLQNNKVLYTPVIAKNEAEIIQSQVEFVEIFDIYNNRHSITSVIKKS